MREIIVLLALIMVSSAYPATIILNYRDITDAAVLGAVKPYQSWPYGSDAFYMGYTTMLIKFDFSRIPKDARITSARLHLYCWYSNKPYRTLFSVWRALCGWGNGVCYDHRGGEKKIPWSVKGARGLGSDIPDMPTDTVEFIDPTGWFSYNVTMDVNTFLSGGENNGWLVGLSEGFDQDIRVATPINNDSNIAPYLLVTYEPK